MKIKHSLFVVLICGFCFGPAFAAGEAGNGVSMDLSLYLAEGSEDVYPGLLGGSGVELGINVGLKRLGLDVGTWKGMEFAGRASICYFDWNDGEDSDSYERIPLFIGIRSVLPVISRYVQLFAQIGPELSMDRMEDYDMRGNLVSKDDAVRLGITPGVGILFNINRVYLGISYHYHVITDPYSNAGITIGYNF